MCEGRCASGNRVRHRTRAMWSVCAMAGVLLGAASCDGPSLRSTPGKIEAVVLDAGPCWESASGVACAPSNGGSAGDDAGSNTGADQGDGGAGTTPEDGGSTTTAPFEQGWMTGGGSVLSSSGERITHGFVLRCDLQQSGQSLEVNWPLGRRFHLTMLNQVTCLDLPSINPGRPVADFNTIEGHGTGDLDGQAGATVDFLFTDDGQPRDDFVSLTFYDASGQLVLSVEGALSTGNQQAHH